MIRIQLIAQCLHLLRCLIRSNADTSEYGQLQIIKRMCCYIHFTSNSMDIELVMTVMVVMIGALVTALYLHTNCRCIGVS